MSKVPITVEGAEKLRAELKKLKNEDRPRISKAIAEARAHGDLKENAEYHAAKEEQGLSEARLRDIEGKLSNAQIIDIKAIAASDKVIFGATVVLYDTETEAEVRYRIVGDDESDISAGMLSVSAPIARAIIGKREGDEVDITTPGGQKSYEVIEVLYI
ncbi:MAG: transcription elongation factor GreA [Gammaproteobacteria bacterium]|nr:transcription elongation factor GreA [Gammaproteobacteria bacterium]MCP4090000.1 transcription elongation factor GreA [Gammaproteobacteria bacterium]MCP4277780.1 transcription elongation factor GreA [Gammaproteobacteria bacterium]MCP4831664.1 transcription elongation factor GreA [Gammaproteobacteria bacterium]MCP4929310.1 transcription elongation factor GreA [Gammaproteobacteria bacterium]